MSGISPSPQFVTFSSIKSNTQIATHSSFALNFDSHVLSDLKLKKQLGLRFGNETTPSRSSSIRCNGTTGPVGPSSGENESKNVLDAFFLGKALAEAVNERIESTVGEFLSTIGRLQAEQQKQIQDFQEDVFERARRAKENAAREAMEAQGLVPKPPGSMTYGVNSAPATDAITPRNSSPSPNSTSVRSGMTGSDPGGKGPAFEASNEDD